MIWLEDLLVLHRGNTSVWGLYVLVQDSQQAAGVLRATDYERISVQTRSKDQPEFAERSLRMARPLSETGVVLLPVQDWYYESDEDMEGFLPPLNVFLDSMLELWLDCSPYDCVERLGFTFYVSI